MENDDVITNRITDLLGQFAAKLVHQHAAPPESVARAAVGLAITLYMAHCQDSPAAAAAYLRQFVDTLEQGAQEQQPPTLN